MQADFSEKVAPGLGTAVTTTGIVIAIILFGLIINQMGLLNGLFSPEIASPAGQLQVAAENMRFGQETLRVRADQPVQLALANHDLYGHSFDVDELDLHIAMPANGRTVVEFTAPEPGVYTIYCAVPGHREAGMISTLVVDP